MVFILKISCRLQRKRAFLFQYLRSVSRLTCPTDSRGTTSCLPPSVITVDLSSTDYSDKGSSAKVGASPPTLKLPCSGGVEHGRESVSLSSRKRGAPAEIGTSLSGQRFNGRFQGASGVGPSSRTRPPGRPPVDRCADVRERRIQ